VMEPKLPVDGIYSRSQGKHCRPAAPGKLTKAVQKRASKRKPICVSEGGFTGNPEPKSWVTEDDREKGIQRVKRNAGSRGGEERTASDVK